MAAKCNLLRGLTQNGTFFMFSEYAENLTKSYVQENQYRVIPSKYAMLNLNYGGKTAKSVGEIFQNYYENACSCFRKQNTGVLTHKELANELLWKTLYKYGFITTGSADNSTFINELHYVGDIRLTPFEEIDGVGYNELWCYIDNDVHATHYHTTYPSNQNQSVQFEGVGDYISGYDSTTYPTANADLSGQIGETYIDDSGNGVYYMDDVQEKAIIPYIFSGMNNDGIATQSLNTSEEVQKEFTFNTVIVFFDVYDSNSDILYSNIPMGMYFTGVPAGSTLTNEIIKVVSDETLYNQGTSYGLRINTKFVCTPQTTGVNILKISGLTGEEADRYCALLSSIADSQQLMEKMVADQANFNQSIKNHLSLFANYRANVPYIRVIAGVRHWFVNGKDMGAVDNSEKINSVINIDSYNNIHFTNSKGTKEWMTYNDFDDIVISSKTCSIEAEALDVVNPQLNKQVVSTGADGSTNLFGLNVYNASTQQYDEIFSLIRSTIRHDETINIKFLINGDSPDITIDTDDWTKINRIEREGQRIIYNYLTAGDKITVVKWMGNRNLTPLLLNYEYVDNGANSYYEFISYTTLWIPGSTTTMENIIRTQLGLSTTPTKILQNKILNFNYVYAPRYNYTSESHLFISFNDMNNTIFGGDNFPNDASKYDDTYFTLNPDIQIQYPESDNKIYTALPIFEARRGCKDIYIQKNFS